jgi:hypothetical protein
MARTTNRLTALTVQKLTEPGMYADGNGLYLRFTPGRTKNWVLRFMLNGRARWMGLGPYPLYGLTNRCRRGATWCRSSRARCA